MRTIASQMEDAKGQTVSLRIAGTSIGRRGRRVRRVRHRDHVPRLPRGLRGGTRRGRRGEPDDEETSAGCRTSRRATRCELRASSRRGTRRTRRRATPRRRSCATLEELGIGRPSTYASILGTILDRGYVFKKGTALVPSFLAFSVVGLLEQHFGQLVDYDFTARMEDDLDRIAAGDEQRIDWLRRFYYGDGDARPEGARRGPRRHRRARDQLDRDRRRRSCFASAATAPISSATVSGRTFPTTSSPTS